MPMTLYNYPVPTPLNLSPDGGSLMVDLTLISIDWTHENIFDDFDLDGFKLYRDNVEFNVVVTAVNNFTYRVTGDPGLWPDETVTIKATAKLNKNIFIILWSFSTRRAEQALDPSLSLRVQDPVEGSGLLKLETPVPILGSSLEGALRVRDPVEGSGLLTIETPVPILGSSLEGALVVFSGLPSSNALAEVGVMATTGLESYIASMGVISLGGGSYDEAVARLTHKKDFEELLGIITVASSIQAVETSEGSLLISGETTPSASSSHLIITGSLGLFFSFMLTSEVTVQVIEPLIVSLALSREVKYLVAFTLELNPMVGIMVLVHLLDELLSGVRD